MTILVTNKVARTLEIRTKDKEVYYIPPRVRNLKVELKNNDIVYSSPDLIITRIN